MLFRWGQFSRLAPQAALLLGPAGADHASQALLHGLGEGWRHLSTQPAAPSLKAATRALLKKVHPDLFHHHPQEKEANERSFKLLQEYLAAAKTGGGIGRTAGLPYHFLFYIFQDDEEEEEGAAVAAAAAAAAAERAEPAAAQPGAGRGSGGGADVGEQQQPAFKKVALTLPPPIKAGPGDELSASSRKAFAKLLAACGIPWDPASDPPASHHYSRLTSLRDFVPQAAEQMHQAAAQQAGPRQQLGALRTALRLGQGVTLAFAEPAASAGVVAQLTAAQQLAAALDALSAVDLRGLRVMVGEAYGVDALGNVWLHADDSAAAWQRYLAQVDFDYCRGRQGLVASAKGQEAAVARALGVAMVYTHPQFSVDPAYLGFLERAAAAAGERGPAGGGRLGDVPVMVHADPSEALDAEGENSPGEGGGGRGGGRARGAERGDPLSAPSLDDTAGVVLVPASTPADALYEALERLGPRAQALLRAARDDEAAAAQLRTTVERKLRLRRLSRAAGVPPERFRSACLRMMQHSAALGPLLGGLAVRVAEVNGLPPDKSWIDIAWNFEL